MIYRCLLYVRFKFIRVVMRSHESDGKVRVIIFSYCLRRIINNNYYCLHDVAVRCIKYVHENSTPRDDLYKRKLDCCELCRRRRPPFFGFIWICKFLINVKRFQLDATQLSCIYLIRMCKKMRTRLKTRNTIYIYSTHLCSFATARWDHITYYIVQCTHHLGQRFFFF